MKTKITLLLVGTTASLFAAQPVTYNGNTFMADVVEVIPAQVKLRTQDGKTGTLPVDKLNLEFAATLEIENNPYAQLLALRSDVDVFALAPAQGQKQAEKQEEIATKKAVLTDVDLKNFTRVSGTTVVQIESIEYGKIELEGMLRKEKSYSDKEVLILGIKITNNHQTRKVDYTSWRGEYSSSSYNNAKLTDERNSSYKNPLLSETGMYLYSSLMKPVKGISTASIYPKQSVTDVLIFERPSPTVQTLTLTLPARNVAEPGKQSSDIIIKIPTKILPLD